MTYEDFQQMVETMIDNLHAIKTHSVAPWAFKYHDYPISVCECAAELSGYDATFAKMFNAKFREDAVKLAFDKAKDLI